MSDTISRKSPVALATAAALMGAAALPAHSQEPEQRLETVSVQGEVIDGKRVEAASSPKYTTTLTDTPQSITVVTRESIDEQNLLSLRDVLSTVPGITFGAGEGGGGYGDSITLRGFSGSNDVTIDGLRDSAQYTRSDPFNLEQVEVVSGASSVYSGAGSLGGTVNLVSKTAQAADFSRFTVGGGTDSYARVTTDINRTFGQGGAVRFNAMGHRNDVPGRKVENNERWGVAPSIAIGLGGATTLALSYLHQHDDNIPQYGVPTYFGRLLPGAKYSNYYGYRNIDRQVIDIDAFTVGLSHVFSDALVLRNQTRWQQTSQLSRVDPPQGTWCLANGLLPDGDACPTGYLPGQYQPSGPRGTTRDTRNQILVTQTDLTSSFRTGSVEHTLVTGFSLSSESYFLRNGNSLRHADGTPNPALPRTSIATPDTLYTGPVNFITSSTTDSKLDNRAIYAFDNIQLSSMWSLNGGVRLERNEASSTLVTYDTPAAGGGATPTLPSVNDDTLFSYRAAVLFKPLANSSFYLAFGNSQTPSTSSVNGRCSTSATAGNCNLDPEEGESLELGTKWDLLGNRLSLTAAVARNERTNYRVSDASNPDNPTGEQVLDGSARVDSLMLGVAGLLADNWSVFANYTFLDSEVLQGASDFVSANGQDYTRGDPLTNVPRHAASLWTTYEPMRGFQLGYGLTYQGKVYIGQHTSPTGNYPAGAALPTGASYTVHRAMASYQLNPRIQVQFNVNNLLDKQYLTRLRTQQIAWATPGEARSFVLSANLRF